MRQLRLLGKANTWTASNSRLSRMANKKISGKNLA